MTRWRRSGLILSAILMSGPALAQTPAPTSAPTAAPTAAPTDAYLYVIWPRDGQKVRSPFWVRFGLRNMGVTRAGDKAPNVGHHHLLVDTDAGTLDAGEPIPTDKKHLHFGGGQTEANLDLPPGRHTLQLALGDAEHKLFSPPVISKKITITVIEPARARTSQR